MLLLLRISSASLVEVAFSATLSVSSVLAVVRFLERPGEGSSQTAEQQQQQQRQAKTARNRRTGANPQTATHAMHSTVGLCLPFSLCVCVLVVVVRSFSVSPHTKHTLWPCCALSVLFTNILLVPRWLLLPLPLLFTQFTQTGTKPDQANQPTLT